MIELHDDEIKNLNFFNFNRKFKKTIEKKINKKKQKYHLINVLIIVVSIKIIVKNKKFSNMKNEITLMKLNERFFSRQNEKNLNVIFEYNYFSYVNEIVFVVIQI